MKRLWERIKAWFRGERLRKDIPKGCRGRIYEPRKQVVEIDVPVEEPEGSGIIIMKKAKVGFEGKVIRADGTEEPLNVDDITLEIDNPQLRHR